MSALLLRPAVLALAAASGTFLLYSSLVLGWVGLRPGPILVHRRGRRRLDDWMVQAGLSGIRVRDFVAVTVVLAVIVTACVYAVFGAPAPAVVVGAITSGVPVASYRVRRASHRARAQEAWPGMIEEIRILTGSVGRSIPQALFEVGRRAPEEMRPAFEAAQREWLISTDFTRTISVLKAGLADPTADATCETLLVAHQVGGHDLDRRLAALVEDRVQDTQGRKDARAKQAGARFARRFVVIAPVGMALAGMSVGDGRRAYQTTTGQTLAVMAVLLVVACWVWAGRILRLPEEERVFDR